MHGPVKRTVIVIPLARLDEVLTLKVTHIHSFVQVFPVDEFECSHVQTKKIENTKTSSAQCFRSFDVLLT